MRQSGVVAAAGLFALENNVERLSEDHERTAFLHYALKEGGFRMAREAETNLIFFGMPEGAKLSVEDFAAKVRKGGVLVGSGYDGGKMCRAAIHKHITDEDVDKAAKVMIDALS